MTSTPQHAATSRPGRPPVVDLPTWQAARDELLLREKAHTREGDAIAAARRRLPMVEFDPSVEVVGPDGAVPFLDLFEGRDELVVYKHMWYDGAPHQGQCEGCTTTAWHLKDAVYLEARGVSLAIVTTGPWSEVADYVAFMGYTQPWYSVRGLDEPVGGDMGYLTSFLRDGDRAFLTYSTTGRGNERVSASLALLDITPYGRRERWEENPEGWPEGGNACWHWRSDADGNAAWGPTSRPCRSGRAPAPPRCRPSADGVATADALPVRGSISPRLDLPATARPVAASLVRRCALHRWSGAVHSVGGNAPGSGQLVPEAAAVRS